MSITRKLEILFLALLGFSLLFLGWRNHALTHKVEDLQLKIAPTAANAKAATVKSEGVQRVYLERDANNAALNAIFAANPEYSTGAVPSDVADRLRSPTGSARGVP